MPILATRYDRYDISVVGDNLDKGLYCNSMFFLSEDYRMNEYIWLSNFNLFLKCVGVVFYTGSTHACTPKSIYFIKTKIKRNPNKLKGISR